MSVFFWADTHFNHEGIIALCARPFSTVNQMNNELVLRWNDAVKPTDTIYFAGDFGFARKAGESLGDIFAALNGHKHLVAGNHDEQQKAVMRLPWESISKLVTVKDQGMRAEVCHYALESWKRAQHGALMVHGHSHGTMKRVLARRFDVGVDVATRPVALRELADVAADEPFVQTDYHHEPPSVVASS